jgi:hypothetical protein
MSDDLSIPDFLLVKNRRGVGKAAAERRTDEPFVEPWEAKLVTLEPELQSFLRDMMRRGRFERTWLVADHRRPETEVDETVGYWRTKLEARQAQTAARAAQAKVKRRAGAAKAEPPAELDPAAVILFGGKNPKKEGTSAHKRWTLLMQHDGRTVGEYLKAKGNPTTLTNAIKSGHVTFETAEEGEEVSAPAAEKIVKKPKSRAKRSRHARKES